jgi:hypothetical protein
MVALVLFGFTFSFAPKRSSASQTSQPLNNQVTVLQSRIKTSQEKRTSPSDQVVVALQSGTRDPSENERLRQRFESLQQQSNVRRREAKPAQWQLQ